MNVHSLLASRCAPATSRNPFPRPCDALLLWYDARMDTPHTHRPHLELGDICRIEHGIFDLKSGDSTCEQGGFGLVIGGVEGQVVDLLVEGRLVKLNRRFLEPFAREVIDEAG